MSYSSKKVIHLILITIAMIIWFTVFYRIISPFKNSEESGINNNNNPLLKKKIETTYPSFPISKLNDPFSTPFNKKIKRNNKNKGKQLKKNKSEIVFPQLDLLGIIIDKRGKMAIIRFPDNSIYFVREKEKIKNIFIKKIEKKVLKYVYSGIEKTISL